MPAHVPLVLPDGGPLPLPYRWLHAHGVHALRPWHVLDEQSRALGLRTELLFEVAAPNPSEIRDWMPFASLQTQDDFAGFVLIDGEPTGEVCVVHLTWKSKPELPGWPTITRYRDGWELDRAVPLARHAGVGRAQRRR